MIKDLHKSKDYLKDNCIIELDEYDIDIINKYRDNDKLHPDFLPMTTYDMIQAGFPYPDHGVMVARNYGGGTDEEERLLPSKGMWCKVEDVMKLLVCNNCIYYGSNNENCKLCKNGDLYESLYI